MIRIGARTSPLARTQADAVAALLHQRGHQTTFVGVTTTGDVDYRDLTQIGGTGVFVQAVRQALRAGRIDVAVHSLKDLPTAAEPDLDVVAVPPREDVRDVLIGVRLDDLRDGMRIGTGAPRRAVQIAALAAQRGVRIEVVPVRGNVDTRLAKVRDGVVDAVLLAAAGLRRLGRLETPGPSDQDENLLVDVAGLTAQILTAEQLLPAPGQGALALEIHRSLSQSSRAAIQALDHPASHAESLVERGFLAALEAGCTAPVGAAASIEGTRGTTLDLTLLAVIGKTLLSDVSELDGTGSSIRRIMRGSSSDPADFGAAMGRQVLAELAPSGRSEKPVPPDHNALAAGAGEAEQNASSAT